MTLTLEAEYLKALTERWQQTNCRKVTQMQRKIQIQTQIHMPKQLAADYRAFWGLFLWIHV